MESSPKWSYRLIHAWVYIYKPIIVTYCMYVFSSCVCTVYVLLYRRSLFFLAVCWSDQIFRMRDSNGSNTVWYAIQKNWQYYSRWKRLCHILLTLYLNQAAIKLFRRTNSHDAWISRHDTSDLKRFQWFFYLCWWPAYFDPHVSLRSVQANLNTKKKKKRFQPENEGIPDTFRHIRNYIRNVNARAHLKGTDL